MKKLILAGVVLLAGACSQSESVEVAKSKEYQWDRHVDIGDNLIVGAVTIPSGNSFLLLAEQGGCPDDQKMAMRLLALEDMQRNVACVGKHGSSDEFLSLRLMKDDSVLAVRKDTINYLPKPTSVFEMGDLSGGDFAKFVGRK